MCVTGIPERAAVVEDHGVGVVIIETTPAGIAAAGNRLDRATIDARRRPSRVARRQAAPPRGLNGTTPRAGDRYRRSLPDGLLVPCEDGAVHHLVVRVPAGKRDSLIAALAAGVETGVRYPPALSEQPAFAACAGSRPEAEAAAAEVLSLPPDPSCRTTR